MPNRDDSASRAAIQALTEFLVAAGYYLPYVRHTSTRVTISASPDAMNYLVAMAFRGRQAS